MRTLDKSWNSTTPSSKKFLSRLLSHHLSRKIDGKKYEVVHEGSLDLFNPYSEEPDVVVYSKDKEFVPVMAVETCKTGDVLEMTLLARMLLNQYTLKEFFVFDNQASCWYRLKKNETQVEISPKSDLLNINLEDIVYLYPHLNG